MLLEGLQPKPNTRYDKTTGLPFEVVCERTNQEMALVPAGEFIMGADSGADDEMPVHKVYLNSYYIDKYEVTSELFAKFLNAYGRETDENGNEMTAEHRWGIVRKREKWETTAGCERHPVVNVSWFGAMQYAKWAGLWLPTEAQWEKAARGASGRKYPWGNKFEAHWCNSYGSGTNKTAPVGEFESDRSPYGCYDMAGNVWEWCADWYNEQYYSHSPKRNPIGPPNGQYRVLRGGCIVSKPDGVTCTVRFRNEPSVCFHLIGFRCVVTL